MISRILASFLAVTLSALPLVAQVNTPDAPKKVPDVKAAAHSAPAETPPTLQLQITIVSVPRSESLSLIEQLKNPAEAAGAYHVIAANVQTKRAKLIAAPTMETRSGNRCVLESIHEVRYAIQFQRIDGHSTDAPRPVDAARALVQQAPAAVGVVPTAFETRNTGITFEAEPILGPDGNTVDVQFAAQHCQLLGWDTSTIEQGGKIVQQTPQPRFHTNKISTNMSLSVGQYALAGVFESGTDPEVVEIFILQATKRTGPAK